MKLTRSNGDAAELLRQIGCVLLDPAELARECALDLNDLDALAATWDRLPRDQHLRDSGNYRSRRHSCFIYQGGELRAVPHRAHWQPTEYNALHGGMQRWFEPISEGVTTAPAWQRLLSGLSALLLRCAAERAVDCWHIEAHQFRIDTAEGIGRPTPEGAHRDGVDFVAVILVRRQQVRGGETRVFEMDGPAGLRFTMEAPWTTLLLDDARVIHETTPIQPDGDNGVRDTLVLTFRQQGFQSPE